MPGFGGRGANAVREMDILRRYLKVVGVGVCVGILLCVVRAVFRIESAVFWHWYFIAGVLVVLGAALYNFLYLRKYAKRLRAAIAHYEKGETAIYMDEIEDMLRTAKGRNLRNTLKIDLSAGYYAKGEYGRAIEILEEMADEPLRGVLRMVHRLNLCLYYFRISRNDAAMELYHAGEKEFDRCRKNKDCGGDIALVDMLAAIENGRYGEAEEMLAYARQTWDSPRLREEYRMAEDKLAGLREPA